MLDQGFAEAVGAGTVLPSYTGNGIVSVVPTVEQHFGLTTATSGLSPDVLPPDLLDGAQQIVTFVIDALGYQQLTRALDEGHAPFLAGLIARGDASLTPITSTFPSTTVTALTTLGTGLPPSQHGVISHRFYDRTLGAVIDVLSFTPAFAGKSLEAAGLNPVNWIGIPSVFERLDEEGVRSAVVNHAQFEGTSLSRINHRGARYIGFRTVSDLMVNLRAAIESADRPAYIHSYWATLDTLAHVYGTGTRQLMAEVRVLDHSIGKILLEDLRAPGTLMLIFADHGHVNTSPDRVVRLNDHPDLLALLQAPPTGLDRATLLYVTPGFEEEARQYAEEWLGDRVRVLTSAQVVEMELYGPEPIPARTRDRMGQLLLLPKENWLTSYEYPGRDGHHTIIGRHGGLSREEMLVPLLALRLG